MPFEYQTICKLDNFWPFEYQTSPVFRWLLYFVVWSTDDNNVECLLNFQVVSKLDLFFFSSSCWQSLQTAATVSTASDTTTTVKTDQRTATVTTATATSEQRTAQLHYHLNYLLHKSSNVDQTWK